MRTPRAGLRCLVVPTLTTVVLAAAACHTPTLSDLELDECPSTVPVVAGVIVSVSDSTLRVGSTTRAMALPVDARGTWVVCAPDVQFASSDPGVAMVSSDRLVTGMNTGSAYIRTSSGAARDSLAINVVAAAVASVAVR